MKRLTKTIKGERTLESKGFKAAYATHIQGIHKVTKMDKKDIVITGSQKILITELADYQKGAVVSRTLIDKEPGTVTFFAFDEGQKLSEHTAPFDALVHIVDGEAEITISGNPLHVKEGEMVLIPAHEPHSVKAVKKFKMILTMIRS
jgi:quercetin dioxygenase-like cupin family protein